jgi:hypothetical protein
MCVVLPTLLVALLIRRSDFMLQLGFMSGLILMYAGMISVLPYGKPDVLYLRSFVRDPANARLRRTLEIACGSLRFAGVLEPKLRMPAILRGLLLLPFILMYGSNRRMALEAGWAWRPRLLVSLSSACLAVVDCRHSSKSIRDEIELVLYRLPRDRLLFLINPGQSLQDDLGVAAAARARTVEASETDAGLVAVAAALHSMLPPRSIVSDGTIDEDAAMTRALEMTGRSRDEVSRELVSQRVWFTTGILILAGMAVFAGTASALTSSTTALVAITLMAVVNLSLSAWFGVRYICERVAQRTLWRRLALRSDPPSLRGSALLIPAGIIVAMAVTVLRSLPLIDESAAFAQVTQLRSTLQNVQVTWQLFVVEHDRPPTTAEELCGRVCRYDGVRVDVEQDGDIHITVLGRPLSKLQGRSLTLTPPQIEGGGGWQCAGNLVTAGVVSDQCTF